jgi:transcriptional regulator with XRE-family HTH domain
MAKNLLTEAPPYEVERAVRKLGANLRNARLRRNLTINQVAEKIGTGPRAVMDAEKGKLTTGFGVYAALLWCYGLLGQMAAVADPSTDSEGLALERLSGRTRARAKKSEGLDDDF